jgi:hypothetical protein
MAPSFDDTHRKLLDHRLLLVMRASAAGGLHVGNLDGSDRIKAVRKSIMRDVRTPSGTGLRHFPANSCSLLHARAVVNADVGTGSGELTGISPEVERSRTSQRQVPL